MKHNYPNTQYRLIITALLLSLGLTACASSHDGVYYADKDCQQIREFARQQFLDKRSNIAGNYSDSNESNDILGAIFQSDPQKENFARDKAYKTKC